MNEVEFDVFDASGVVWVFVDFVLHFVPVVV